MAGGGQQLVWSAPGGRSGGPHLLMWGVWTGAARAKVELWERVEAP